MAAPTCSCSATDSGAVTSERIASCSVARCAIDGRVHTIIGVMPPGFDPPQFAWLADQAFWRPFGPTDSNRWLGAISARRRAS